MRDWFCKITGGHVNKRICNGTMQCWKCGRVKYFDEASGWPPVGSVPPPPRPPQHLDPYYPMDKEQV